MILRRFRRKPLVSVVVVLFNMAREAPRTLFSLSPAYQRGLGEGDYEVIVVENGSREALPEEAVAGLPSCFKYHFLETSSVSPARALNYGVARSSGEFLGLMVDGARLLSPGILKYAALARKLFPDPVVATLAWHLGPDIQYRSVQRGYGPQAEDELLSQSGWTEDGYQLFTISTLAGSSIEGFFLPLAESNCLFVTRRLFESLGGFDERFNLPGGGLVNLDFYRRACDDDATNLVVLLGEGTFHQVHGGVSTNVSEERNLELWHEFERQYREIRSVPYVKPSKAPEYLGHVPRQVLPFMEQSLRRAAEACPNGR